MQTCGRNQSAAWAQAGAKVFLISRPVTNSSAADYRRISAHDQRQEFGGYVYASAGANESSKDLVFGGHLMIAEAGQLIADSERFSLQAATLIAEIVQWLNMTVPRTRHPAGGPTPYRIAGAYFAAITATATRVPKTTLCTGR